ncbi:MAG: hypothetical protein IAC13_07735 [Firmicutes bacterium]|uniref:Uncharacterized protein n=1 Tax=Candidatus Scybalomonas excrementavium TaxID=2840943 RepID=A0A9D9N8D9_9FIRM|nr:hypothetical protein [Candidatus Scybalomonas excrementavium]
MKKTFIYASVIGVVGGVIYWLCKKEKCNNTISKSVDKKVDFESKSQEKSISQESNVVEEMYQVKDESVQSIYERHLKAGEIMKDAYQNIMEDFVENFSSKKVVTEKDENKEVIIDNESISVMKELDSISGELDDLLK